MTEYLVNDTDMTKVADAIRAKGNTTDPLSFPDGMAAMINSIQSGGGGIDISFINAVNNSGYNDTMLLEGAIGRIECDFTLNGEYNFEIPKPIPIKEFFNEFSVAFVAPISFPIRIILNITDKATGQSGLQVVLMPA